jgi:uncharacterized membrane protein
LAGLILSVLSWGFLFLSSPARAAGEVVEVVFYYEAGCEACEKVLHEVLPPLQAKYQDQLVVNLFELTTLEDIDTLYRVGSAYGLAKDQVGVPLLVIGDAVLVGSEQIPRELPGLIAAHLAKGGVKTVVRDYPQLSLAMLQTEEPVWSGMELAWALMALMALALAIAVWQVARAFQGKAVSPPPAWLDRSIPILALVGLGIAGYMTYIEATYTPAFCGPLGDCNAVQTSPYARLFGFLPVGLFGAAGYLAILVAWSWPRLRRDKLAQVMPVAILGMAAFGTLFSVYLTYLEIFVIRAVCIWCLSSALVITLLLLASLPSAARWLALAEDEP